MGELFVLYGKTIAVNLGTQKNKQVGSHSQKCVTILASPFER